jgi:uncharacterized pyridoxamine 5'-phosphate oxidase family protein
MNYTQEFNNIVQETSTLALATSVDGIPNVRIVNFGYDTSKPGVIYFSSTRTSPKLSEFAQNSRVAFTTVPAESHTHVRSNNSLVQKSALYIDEIKDLFLAQIPGFDVTLSVLGSQMDIYEIHIKEATVILGPGKIGTVSF